MIHEQTFTCWKIDQDEETAKEVTATTLRAAARKAVDLMRQENEADSLETKFTVFVRDEAKRMHQIIVHIDSDEKPTEAYF